MGVTSVSDSFGITIAAAVAIPVHNYLCTLPRPMKWYLLSQYHLLLILTMVNGCGITV